MNAHDHDFDGYGYGDNQAPAQRPAPRPGLPSAYVFAWAGLASIAVAYLAMVSVRSIEPPGLLAKAPATATVPAAESAAVATAKIRQSLKDFQGDIGHLRADLEARSQDQSLVANLMAIEERMSIETGMPIARPQPAAPGPLAALADAPAAAQTEAPAPAAAPLPAKIISAAPQPTVAAAKAAQASQLTTASAAAERQALPLETGTIPAPPKPAALPKAIAGPGMPHPSTAAVQAAPQISPAAGVAAAPIAFGAPTVKAEPKPFAVQLASGTTIDSIRLSWSLLADQHSDALRNLQPRVTATGTEAAGQTFDLLAGPIKSAADAKKICKALAARGTDCRVAAFAGEGL